jgi:hypothetical protein
MKRLYNQFMARLYNSSTITPETEIYPKNTCRYAAKTECSSFVTPLSIW